MMQKGNFKKSSHSPIHLFRSGANYMLTASTYQGRPVMNTAARKEQWKRAFLTAAKLYGWEVIAWVVLDNHYHVLVHAPANAANLSAFVASYHKYTARLWNREDRKPGRIVWWNYWDRCVRSEKELLARLNYLFQNPIKHGLATTMEDYRFSNYSEFLDRHDGANLTVFEEVTDVPEV